jgi:hypothetical protein
VNIHDEMTDNEVLDAASRSLSAIPMASRPDVESIMARGRVRRWRRRSVVPGLSLAAVATALVLGLTSVLTAAPARDTGTIQTTAFTLVKHANGTVALTINLFGVLETSTLQRDLRQDGIPAIVTTGSFCSSAPAPAGFAQVVTTAGPKGSRTLTINPAAMPAGTELSFGYFHTPPAVGTPAGQASAIALISTNSYTCARPVVTATDPAPGAAEMVVNIPR